ncbi:uncharacterized protein LOC128233072 isoform X2 [Mya arenaria]|uniref:uncharacterized protein LOC128233072 isoform X2 n=1 Tax=Mya arenaria TaxID=6604 RepID=UPI0022E7E989|nr:uncharacterized protein LOC128233072 isoform X2 [Mya arenaria]
MDVNLAVIATLSLKVHGWVECPKDDWPYCYVCFNDQDCCEYERCCERPSSSTSSTRHGAVERSSRGRINVILETVIPFIVFCIIVIVCFQCCKHSREGVIHPSHAR